MSQLSAGQAAPAFSLPADDGTTVSKDSMRGKRFVLYFYPKDETPGCIKEACAFNDNLTAFQSAKVPVLGVSPDDATSHRAFRTRYGLQFSLLSDTDRRALEAYGAWGDRPGRGVGVIRSTFLVSPEGTIERAWYNVSPEGHAAEVLAAIPA